MAKKKEADSRNLRFFYFWEFLNSQQLQRSNLKDQSPKGQNPKVKDERSREEGANKLDCNEFFINVQ